MKKIVLSLILLNLILVNSFAQIKVYSGGNMYVGSTAATGPSNKLQVVGNSTFTSGTGTITSSPFIKGTNTWSSATAPDYTWTGCTATTGIFHTGNNMIGFATNGVERLRINATGKILNGNSSSTAGTPDYTWKGDTATGIFHTTTPASVGISVSGSEKFRINAQGQILSGATAGTASSPDYTWNTESSTGMYRAAANTIAFSTSSQEKMRISAANNVQINTTSINSGKLNVASSNGNRAIWCEYTTNADWQESMVINVDRGNSGNYVVKQSGTTNFYVAGAGWIYSQGLYLGSDLNLKSNVTTIGGAMQKINAMRGVTYNLKTEVSNPSLYGLTSPNTYMGVIAQEVEAVAPELVKLMPNGTKAVAYQNMVGLLIEAIKEQNAQLEQLKTEMAVCCTAKTTTTERLAFVETATNLNDAKAASVPYLGQNKPNPFNQSTVIDYFIPESVINASLLIFDLNGKLLKSFAITSKGEGNIVIDSKQLQAGMYLYTLLTDGKELATKRMILTDK